VAVPLPQDVLEVLQALDDNDRRAETLVRDLEEERFNWRPDERSWSVAQCLDHLNVANLAYLGPMRAALERARRAGKVRRGAIRPGFVGRWFVATLEPPPKRKLPAPKKIVPAARKGRDEVMREWRRVQSEVKELLRDAAGADLNGVRFVNPFFSLIRFSAGTGFQVIAAHERRHLWQAERVVANPRFPQVSRSS
jgi:nucleotide-binding universal stress UspA family protein